TVNMACCWRTLGLLLCIAVLAVDTQMPGGLQDVSTDREDVQRAARFAVAEYNKGSNHPYSSKMIRIVSAQAQVVAGMKYYLHIEMERTHGCHNEVKASSDYNRDNKLKWTDDSNGCKLQLFFFFFMSNFFKQFNLFFNSLVKGFEMK
ncbi:CYT protein, partial [Polyodon spathula]|nr:CYT protein [Polyodon spathula]